jgi:hypothetical protein
MTGEELLHGYAAGDRDFRNADLQGAALQNADLQGAALQNADLRNADLRNANLRNADLRGANLDFSCLPFFCGGLKMKIDRRTAAQIAYHFCGQECDDPDYTAARNAILQFANSFHRAWETGKLEAEEKEPPGPLTTQIEERMKAETEKPASAAEWGEAFEAGKHGGAE